MGIGEPSIHGFALELERDEDEEARRYWLAELSNLPVPAAIRPDRGDGASRSSRRTVRLGWPDGVAQDLIALARGEDTLLHAILASALAVVVYKYGGGVDFVLGVPEYGGFGESRANGLLPIACRLSPGMTVKELLKETNRKLAAAYRHQHYPIALASGEEGAHPHPYDRVVCGLTNIHDDSAAWQTDTHALVFSATRTTEGLEGTLSCDASLYGEQSIDTLADVFLHVLEQMTAAPDGTIGSIQPARQRDAALIRSTFSPCQDDVEGPVLMHRLIEKQSKLDYGRIAVVSEREKLTYGELNERADLLAVRLRERGAGAGSIVGILMERSVGLAVAVLAVLKTGSAYLPLDPSYPDARLTYMLEDSGAAILLTGAAGAERLCYRGETIVFDAAFQEGTESRSKDDTPVANPIQDENANAGAIDVQADVSADSPAYVIYTSGSTGKPKGVVVAHRGFANLDALFRHTLRITAKDRVLQFASASFDASVWELAMALFNGAELHLPPPGALEDYERFTAYMNEAGITVATLPPIFAEHLVPERLPLLRLLITAGSSSNPALARRWEQAATYANAYGPTEATVCASIWLAGAEAEESAASKAEEIRHTVPIGRPIAHAELYVLGPDGQEQPIGVMGELYIGGRGVALGYLGREELTAEKFVPNPYRAGETMYRSGDYARWLPDGNLEYMGRIDHQIKIRGFRIETGEIENALLRHPAITEAAVIAERSTNGDESLCAYLAAAEPIEPSRMKVWLSDTLPAYMIPSSFITLDRLPLTVNGKVDLAALPDKTKTRVETFAPLATDTELELSRLWSQALGGCVCGPDTNYFEAGGHSLRAARLIADIHRRFGVQLTLRDFMAQPTLREMARRIDSLAGDIGGEAIPPAGVRPYYPVAPAQRRLFVMSRFDPGSVAYNLPAALVIEGALDAERLKRAFRDLAGRHEILRTSFGLEAGEPVQYVHAHVQLELEQEDAREDEYSESSWQTALGRFLRPFDPGRAPLLRVRVLRYSISRHVLLLDIHHLLADGISISVFIRDLLAYYEGEAASLPLLPLQYKDYASWQSARLAEGGMHEQETYWLQRFRPPIKPLSLPTDYARSADLVDHIGDSVCWEIPAEHTAALRELAATAGTTLYTVLLSGYALLLARYAGQDDIVVGTPVAGRRHADLQELIGMFINMLPMRIKPIEHLAFSDYLVNVKDTVIEALEHQEYPFDALVGKLGLQRNFGRNPLFDASFALQNMDRAQIEADGLAIKTLTLRMQPVKFDLTLWAEEEGDALLLKLEYRSSLFKRETALRMADDLRTIYSRMTMERQFRLGDVALKCDEARQAERMRLERLERELDLDFDL
ncbi:amino acid adenylation domain-containing protein [Paenibacillus aurantiacus]|uniref:Amino acid adenylation domain-containing protein n=1 Tax=Paenibacillus aurantiacus TaxID=1936118 RepID=A0ABV5KP92_9BACL